MIRLKRLKKWCAYRLDHTGGFSGRPNKLVDVCYSYWLGSLVKHLDLFDSYDLMKSFILTISAAPVRDMSSKNAIKRGGGFRDKPPKQPDYYHTGYALSALSVFGYDLEPIDVLHNCPKKLVLAMQ